MLSPKWDTYIIPYDIYECFRRRSKKKKCKSQQLGKNVKKQCLLDTESCSMPGFTEDMLVGFYCQLDAT